MLFVTVFISQESEKQHLLVYGLMLVVDMKLHETMGLLISSNI